MAYFCSGYAESAHHHTWIAAAADDNGTGSAHDRRAGAGGDGLAHLRTHGEGGKGDARRRQHTVYGDEQRVRVSTADLQEQEAGTVVHEARGQREEGAAHRQGG